MKKNVLTTLATLTVLVAPMNLMANDDSFYIKANIGVGMNLDSDVDNILNTAESAKITYDSGFIGSLAAGYDFANPLRVEIELIKQKNDLEITSNNTLYGSFNEGDLKNHSLMANAFYDVDTGSAWTPFVGAGIGWSRIDINNPGFTDSDSEDDVFAYQLIGGVAYAFNEQWSVDAQYRFKGSSDATIDGADFNVNSNDVMLGLRFSF